MSGIDTSVGDLHVQGCPCSHGIIACKGVPL